MPAERRAIVVGAGLFGLAAAWALSARGWRVEVLEAGPTAGHEWSGSKGGARIFRLGYPDAPYVAMARRAGALWSALERTSGRRLLARTGQAGVGDEASLHAVAGALEAAGAPARWLDPGQAHDLFPHLVAPGPVLFEPESGVLAADECLRALCDVGSFALRTRTQVVALEETAAGVTVVTSARHRLEADVVVLCAGPHSLGLLGRAPAVAAPPSAPQVAYFRPKDGDDAPLPVFIEWGDAMLYGLPVPRGAAHGGTFKVSHHSPGPLLDHEQVAHEAPPAPDDAALLAALTDGVRRLLPTMHPEPVATERCVYDNSADGDFVLDRVGPVVIGCASSGHGFKFGPLIGELLADLADARPASVELTPFRLDRRPDR